MNPSINSLLTHAKEWHQIIDDAANDASCCLRPVIDDGINRTVHALTLIPAVEGSDRQKVDQIINLLASQAIRLPLSHKQESVGKYKNAVEAFFKDAERTDLQSLIQRVLILRTQAFRLSAHNREEIVQMIEAKRRLLTIHPLLNFCRQVDKLTKSASPSQKKIEELKLQAQLFSSSPFKACQIAQKQLKDLTHPVPEKEQPPTSYLQRLLRMIPIYQ